MKIGKIITILVLILTFSCQNTKKDSVIETDPNIEINKDIPKTVDTKKGEKDVFRKITELEKYKEFEELSGQILGDTDLALAYIQKDSLKVLLLEKVIMDSNGKANFMILDKVNLVVKTSDQYIALTQCDLIQNPDDKMIFSLVEHEEVEFFDKILKTWIIDLNENKFKEIETIKVKCLNEWFGYDG
tara:strand:- start:754 stop:1314 length:561 start_codon:yes stop_codon:yes gene_type:complete